MGAACARATVEVIPDRELMISVVDTIVELETLLKQGHSLTKEQQARRRKCDKVVKNIVKLTK